MVIIALLVKCTSRGPVLFQQERVSFDGSRFRIIKFRTMRLDAEVGGPGWTTPGDERVTLVGRVLRSLSLDELPQLFNVLKGDMSIVGPRPERPVFIKEFRQHIPRYMLRHKVPAGITGWAQVNGWRGDTSIDKRIEHDLYYIENWSLFLDIKIVFMTILNGFKNRNAY
jgi:exopolysaccharide biosynthesis polyprenyl glycosylphosphotransferase